MPSDPPRTAAPEPLLVDAKTAASLCGISRSSWDRIYSAGKTPAPLRVGGCVRWRIDDLTAWVAAGCPDRTTFEQLKAAAEGGRR